MWVFFESFSFGDYTNFLEHGKIWTVIYLNPPGKTVLKDGPFFNTDSLSFPASSTFLAGVCRSTKTEEDCTTKGKGEAKSSFTVPCLPILYCYLHTHDPPSKLFWFSEVSCMELLAMESLTSLKPTCQCPPYYKYDPPVHLSIFCRNLSQAFAPQKSGWLCCRRLSWSQDSCKKKSPTSCIEDLHQRANLCRLHIVD